MDCGTFWVSQFVFRGILAFCMLRQHRKLIAREYGESYAQEGALKGTMNQIGRRMRDYSNLIKDASCIRLAIAENSIVRRNTVTIILKIAEAGLKGGCEGLFLLGENNETGIRSIGREPHSVRNSFRVSFCHSSMFVSLSESWNGVAQSIFGSTKDGGRSLPISALVLHER